MERILFFETPVFTGATRVTRTIAKSLRNQYEVDFAVVNPNGLIQEEIQRQIELIKPDILFSSFVSINADVIEVGKKNNLRVYIRTDYKLGDITESIREGIYNSYPLADQIIAQTEEMAKELRSIKGVRPDKVVVVENPVDEEELTRLSGELNPSVRIMLIGNQCQISFLMIFMNYFKCFLKRIYILNRVFATNP